MRQGEQRIVLLQARKDQDVDIEDPVTPTNSGAPSSPHLHTLAQGKELPCTVESLHPHCSIEEVAPRCSHRTGSVDAAGGHHRRPRISIERSNREAKCCLAIPERGPQAQHGHGGPWRHQPLRRTMETTVLSSPPMLAVRPTLGRVGTW